MSFKAGGALQAGPAATAEFIPGPLKVGSCAIGFTRGYLSSQAFADKVKSGEFKSNLRPGKTLDYDTSPYQNEYEWLGFGARKMIFSFLKDCLKDKNTTLDVFAYDLDEPDFVKLLLQFKGRLRIVLDNASLHSGDAALEPVVFQRLQATAGEAHCVRGKFGRFAHQKVLLKRVKGKPVSVLAGSTNFSANGLYINANNVLQFDEPAVADLYGKVFDLAFETTASRAEFLKSQLSQKEFEFSGGTGPHMFLTFSPHATPGTSLDRVLKEVNAANTSVLFAMMAVSGGGKLLERLRAVHADPNIFSYGVSDTVQEDGSGAGDATYFAADQPKGVLVGSAALTKNIPEPFVKEFTGGLAHRIHHKFIVVDFNDSDPVVFAGSSNLADGGEQQNGDNLHAIYNRDIATAYGIEAIRLIDHYAFRASMQNATAAAPLRLRTDAEQWWKRSFTAGDIKMKERLLFSR
jgi:hypothetical protein